jgi:F-type H+-transporting ATPase subunit delta
MNAPEVVRRYAATLLEAAEETGVLDAVRKDVQGVLETLAGSQELADFLANPLLSAEVQDRTLVALFDGKVQPLTRNFLSLVAQRRRAGMLAATLSAFAEMVEEREGVLSAEVVSAVQLSEEQQGRLAERLAAYTGKQIRLHARVDSALRGGLVARVGDTVFDGSLNTPLERLRRRLVGA